MNKLAIIYYSGTGNTLAMANAIKEAVEEADLFEVSSFDANVIEQYDSIALGCPAMGDEELEMFEFAPVYDAIKNSLANKKVGLFGSYGWGDGTWMNNWKDEVVSLNANLVGEPIICQDYPDEETLEKLKSLAQELVK